MLASTLVLRSPFGYYGVDSGTAEAILVLQNRFWYYNIEFGTDRFDFGSANSTQDQLWGFMASPPGPLGRVPGAESGPNGASRGGSNPQNPKPQNGA